VADQLKIIVLGSGTSAGIPTLACPCAVCNSSDPRDNRLRPSVLLQYAGRNVLIDTTPDFRQQALRAGIRQLDAVLFTHSHADHIMGLDDVRPFNFRRTEPIPIYAAEDTMGAIRNAFRYAFSESRPETPVPKLSPQTLTGAPFDLFGLTVQPVRVMHGKSAIYGFRFGGAAYLTDHSEIPEESCALLRDLDILFLDALRHRPHPTHSTVARSLEYVEQLSPRRAYFTHIAHDLAHRETEDGLPPHVRLAYDGLELTLDISLDGAGNGDGR
jgi:phosphoribosyl 1,2-cyclic phosphate phosphodiesterase